jgi:hypothetical protein
MDPIHVQAKGRPRGGVGRPKNAKPDTSTQRDSSQFEIAHAEATGDRNQLKGIHKKPGKRERKSAIKISLPSQHYLKMANLSIS